MATLVNSNWPARRVEYTIQDWLRVHDIGAAAISDVLNGCIACGSVSDFAENEFSLPPSGVAAWGLAAQIMADFFPAHANQIDLVRRSCELRLDAKDEDQPYTLDRGSESFPFVSINYTGGAADFLDVAHEFAHALQIHAARSAFIPPILRELAAFLGELILLRAVEGELCMAWQSDNRHYLGSDKGDLEAALLTDSSPYSYRWNYPIARILAFRLFDIATPEEIWGMFQNRYSLDELFNAANMSVDFEKSAREDGELLRESPMSTCRIG